MGQIAQIRSKIREHGVLGFFRKAAQRIYRTRLHRRFIVYCADAQDLQGRLPEILPPGFTLARRAERSAISESEAAQIASLKGERKAEQEYAERFALGAALWLYKQGDTVHCFVWWYQGLSLDGLVPLAPYDVYLSDGASFPEHRGQGAIGYFLDSLLTQCPAYGAHRVFYAIQTWNKPMLRSSAKMKFRPIGVVDHVPLFGRQLQVWHALEDAPAYLAKAIRSDERS